MNGSKVRGGKGGESAFKALRAREPEFAEALEESAAAWRAPSCFRAREGLHFRSASALKGFVAPQLSATAKRRRLPF